MAHGAKLSLLRFMGLMPAYMEQEGILSTKMVSFYKREDSSSLPSTQATVLLFDPQYGHVKAVSMHVNVSKHCLGTFIAISSTEAHASAIPR